MSTYHLNDVEESYHPGASGYEYPGGALGEPVRRKLGDDTDTQYSVSENRNLNSLEKLIQGMDGIVVTGDISRTIYGIAYNSNQVKVGYIFVAIEGLRLDGHKYIDHAVSKGASVIVASKDVVTVQGVTTIKVKDARAALSFLAAQFYGNPSTKMSLIGITGTNGKTTTTHLVRSILGTSHRNAGSIGTLGVTYQEKHFDSDHTTPESLELQEIFASMYEEGVDACVMEVSSHSLQLERVNNCDFNIGLFTNLTHEHLDMHLNMENYYDIKRKLFYKTKDYNIINGDDPYGRRLIEEVASIGPRLLTYGIENGADITASNMMLSSGYSEFLLNTPKGNIAIKINLLGNYNIYNSLAAASVGYAMGVSLEHIKAGLETVTSIPGRFESVQTGRNFRVILDYAHTPDGFHKFLGTAKKFATGRLIIIFGCVGERDHTKRSVMGEVAQEYCDLCILTTDNCRSEDPQVIINEIKKGLIRPDGAIEILDRGEAIRYAVLNSQENDTIVITGKGNEHKQIIGNKLAYFNEREIIETALEELSMRQC